MIDLTSVQWGLSNGPGTASGATFNNVSVGKQVDSALARGVLSSLPA